MARGSTESQNLSQLHFVRQDLFNGFLDSTGLAAVRPGG